MKGNRPEYSFSNYFYWLGRTVRKWLCVFWVFIPIAGLYFYIRAIINYQLVSPLAALRRGNELQKSRELVRGSWWRVAGSQFVIALPFIALGLINFAIAYELVFVANLKPEDLGSTIFLDLLQNVIAAFSVFVFPVFSCTCYRILSQEARQLAANTMPTAA